MLQKNLKVNFLGDSITEGAFATEDSRCFVSLLASRTGWICRNYGIGGTRIARKIVPSDVALYDRDFCIRLYEMDPDADVVAIFGGTNDFGHGDAPMGTMADRTPDTFYGALHYLYENLIVRYPDAFLFVMTPLHREAENNPRGDSSKECDGPVLREYVRAIREVAEYYSIPVLDLYAMSRIQPEVPALRKKYTEDGLHPNDLGHAHLADLILRFLEANL